MEDLEAAGEFLGANLQELLVGALVEFALDVEVVRGQDGDELGRRDEVLALEVVQIQLDGFAVVRVHAVLNEDHIVGVFALVMEGLIGSFLNFAHYLGDIQAVVL